MIAQTQTFLVHLSREECATRLASVDLGRLGVIVGGRPEIFPVNHVVDPASGFVAFPTHDGTKLLSALDWPWVAFEVDGVDPGTDDGWSVLVVGRAEEIADRAVIERLRGGRNARWGISGSEHWLRIVPSKVTGRKIHAADS